MSDIAQCPKCNGPMWDQKNGRFPWKPGTPIWKCRDKECAKKGGVIWEPKGQGALLPNETGQEEYLNAVTGQATPTPTLAPIDLKKQDVDLLKECVGYALGIVSSAQKVVDGKLDVVFTGDNVCSLASTLFIQWKRR